MNTQKASTDSAETKQKKAYGNASRQLFLDMISFATEFGFSVSLPILIGAFLGVYLDKVMGTAPRLTLSLIFVGVFLGTFTGFWTLKKSLDAYEKRKKDIQDT